MTSHAVLAYPRFSDPDAAWIEALRKNHDPQFHLIRAHFTLAFPAAVAAATLAAEVEKVVAARRAFRIEVTGAIAHRDPLASSSHVFLVPSLGVEEIEALHESLRAGALRPHRHYEIPYIPHLTVAQKRSHAECVELADALSRTPISLNGVIEQIHVVSVGADAVASIAVFDLEPIS
jgi:2'-5' RNA ligase